MNTYSNIGHARNCLLDELSYDELSRRAPCEFILGLVSILPEPDIDFSVCLPFSCDFPPFSLRKMFSSTSLLKSSHRNFIDKMLYVFEDATPKFDENMSDTNLDLESLSNLLHHGIHKYDFVLSIDFIKEIQLMRLQKYTNRAKNTCFTQIWISTWILILNKL